MLALAKSMRSPADEALYKGSPGSIILIAVSMTAVVVLLSMIYVPLPHDQAFLQLMPDVANTLVHFRNAT